MAIHVQAIPTPMSFSASLILWICCVVSATETTTTTQNLFVQNTKKFERKLSPLLRSIFFETEINFGSEGGLYAEQIFNRDFEALGRGTIPGASPSPPSPPHPHINPNLTHFHYLFDGCCRGGPASSADSLGPMSASVCASKCENDAKCNAIEVDGCLANPLECGAKCFLFSGTGPGPIKNGHCVNTGDQKCYAKYRLGNLPTPTPVSTPSPPSPLSTPSPPSHLSAPAPAPSPLRLDPYEPAAVPSSFAPWTVVGSATAQTDTTTQPFITNPTTIKVNARVAGDGVRNPGFWGIDTRPGTNFSVSFYFKSSTVKSVTVSLVDPNTNNTIASVVVDCGHGDGGWQQLSTTLKIPPAATAPPPSTTTQTPKTPTQTRTPRTPPTSTQTPSPPPPTSSSPKPSMMAVFELTANSVGVLNLDAVSVIPWDAVHGLWRRDVFDKLTSLRPGFIRMPGGNYLEGTGPRTRWDWKKTIGPREMRAGHFNSAWHYWVTDAVGLHELLLLCEQTLSIPQLSVYTGYSMTQPYIPLNQSKQFAQDALDMIEYAIGDVTTPYGAKRAAAGHPAPFALNRLEVGNEEKLMSPDDYPGHYKLITSAIWSKYPNMTVIASGHWGPSDVGNPCTTGQRCDAWDEHYYRSPDQMASMGGLYDNYARTKPDVFVGEFAARSMVGDNLTLQGAIAEAVFMLGFEANGDVIRSGSFAPLLCNVNNLRVKYNLIMFDTSRLYAIPSYYMQVMLRDGVGDFVLKSKLGEHSNSKGNSTNSDTNSDTTTTTNNNNTTTNTTNTTTDNSNEGVTIATATIRGSNALLLKYAAYSNTSTLLNVTLDGFTSVHPTATHTVLTSVTSGKDGANTLDDPTAVVPVTSTIAVGLSFTVHVPAWSVVVVELVVND